MHMFFKGISLTTRETCYRGPTGPEGFFCSIKERSLQVAWTSQESTKKLVFLVVSIRPQGVTRLRLRMVKSWVWPDLSPRGKHRTCSAVNPASREEVRIMCGSHFPLETIVVLIVVKLLGSIQNESFGRFGSLRQFRNWAFNDKSASFYNIWRRRFFFEF